MSDNDASRLMCMIHGPNARAVYHHERNRKQRFSLTISVDGFGGVNDMEEIASGKDWETAFAEMWRKR